MKKQIVFTITNDMLYDQRMQKICGTLANNNYDVLLLGFKKIKPVPLLPERNFQQIRLPIIFSSGLLFFIESNLRIFFYLLFKKFDAICAIDLDTIIPVYLLSIVKRKKRVFDAHELFCETHDLALKPRTRKVWKFIEKTFLPKFKQGYTVNKSLSLEYKNLYDLNYDIIRNVPEKQILFDDIIQKKSKNILYQGAVSRGRGVEYFIPAMRYINSKLIICGVGDFFEEAKNLAIKYKVEDKVIFKGLVPPQALNKITASAYIGLNTIENKGKSYYLSLSNRTFDYMNAAIPQVAMNYPEYLLINQEFEIATLIDHLNEQAIVEAINKLLNDDAYYKQLQQNCIAAREKLNWQNEEIILINFYNQLFQV